jgi:hypothetical protein
MAAMVGDQLGPIVVDMMDGALRWLHLIVLINGVYPIITLVIVVQIIEDGKGK